LPAFWQEVINRFLWFSMDHDCLKHKVRSISDKRVQAQKQAMKRSSFSKKQIANPLWLDAYGGAEAKPLAKTLLLS
jgi:hypothetical protein